MNEWFARGNHFPGGVRSSCDPWASFPIAPWIPEPYHSAMRTIGNLESEGTANRFGDYLYVQGIENQMERDDDGTYSIWVLDEDHRARASELLQRFRAAPEAAEFQTAASAARQQRTHAARAESSRRSTVADSARIGYEQNFFGTAYLPLVLIIICVAVGILTRLEDKHPALAPLKISQNYYDHRSETAIRLPDGTPLPEAGFLAEIRAGQIWRLVTPIFIHFTLLHLVFNMMWLRELGTFIETRFGALYLGLFILVMAVLSNLGQAAWGNPNFGGMSGVNYALFGFLWIRGKYDRRAAWQLNKNIIYTMLIWFVVCLTGMLGMSVANTAHAVGLLGGMAWGYVSAKA